MREDVGGKQEAGPQAQREQPVAGDARAPGREAAPDVRASPAAVAQSMRVARADLAKLRFTLPALVARTMRGDPIDAVEVLASRSALQRVDAALALGDADGAGIEDRDQLAAERAELPGEALTLVAGAPRGTGAIAATGVRGASEPLPHLERIQAAFGRHDVSGVRTRSGGDAADASAQLGARAYAYGDRIGFAGAADLHTAAHEAAHVVQQRAGVALAGGAGASGDEYEVHADRVADAVVAGQSAEPILDEMAGRGGGGTHAAVQRKDATAPVPVGMSGDPLPMTATVYARMHITKIVDAVERHLTSFGLPHPHPRLGWVDVKAAIKAIGAGLREMFARDKGMGASYLYYLLPGTNVWHLVDRNRFAGDPPDKKTPDPYDTALHHGPRGTADWFPAVGVAIAAALDKPLIESIHRMGGRYIALLDEAKHRKVSNAELIDGTPLDTVISDVMTDGKSVAEVTKPDGKVDDTDGKRFSHGTRSVTYDWLGATHPELAGWIEVTAPKDAAAEDVIATLVPEKDPDQLQRHTSAANEVKAYPPYFLLPNPLLIPHARSGGYRRSGQVTDFAGMARVLGDAMTGVGVGAGKGKPDLTAAGHAQDRIEAQFAYLWAALSRWGTAAPLLPALDFARNRRGDLTAGTAGTWAASTVAQEHELYGISSEIAQILDDLQSRGMRPEDKDGLGAVIEVLTAYAEAAGLTHAPAQYAPALKRARRLHKLMPLALAESQVEAAADAVREQRDEQNKDPRDAKAIGANETRDAMPSLARRAAMLRAKVNRGGEPDADTEDAIDELSIDADIIAMQARLSKLSVQLGQIERKAEEVGLPGEKIDGITGFWTVRGANREIKQRVDHWTSATSQIKSDALNSVGGPPQTIRARRRSKERRDLAAVANAIDSLNKDVSFKEHFEYAYKSIADKQLADMIFHMALELGLMLVTGQVIGAGMTALRGLSMARRIAVGVEMLEEARSARAVFAVGEMVFQAAGQTGVQAAMGKDVGAKDFAENLLGNAVTAIALKPFEKLLGEAKDIEKETRAWARAAKKAGRFIAQGTVEVGAGIAGAKVAGAIMGHGLNAPQSDELAIQGIAFLAGRAVAKRAAAVNERIAEASKRWGDARWADLRVKTEKLAKQAEAAGENPKPETAVKLLETQREVLLEEQAIYKSLGKSGEVGEYKVQNDLAAMGPEAATIPLRLAELKSVVGETVFEGTHDQVMDALEIANKSGVPMTAKNDGHGVWTITSGDRTFTVHERAGVHKPPKPEDRVLDRRATVEKGTEPALAKQLGVEKVAIDPTLDGGIEVRYEKVKTKLGHDLRVVEVRVGKNARIEDVLIHKETVQRVERYNGALGRLRQVWDRFFSSNRNVKNPFKRGTRGWEAFEEMRKLDALIDARQNWDPKVVDRRVIDDEIRFLEGRKAYYDDIIRSAEETHVIGSGTVAMPDIGVVTREAQSKGYKLPGETPETKGANPDDYYYRSKPENPKEYELVAKPNTAAKSWRAVIKNGKFAGHEAGGQPREVEILTKESTAAEIVKKLRADDSFAAFEKMLVDHGIVRDPAKVKEAIEAKWGDVRDTIRMDTFRGNVKDVFRQRVKDRLATVGHEKMVKMLEGLSVGDRGNLAEAWYQAHYAPGATEHVPVEVARADKGTGTKEDRTIDLLTKGGEAIEIKDIDRGIDKDQFAAYKKLISTGKHVNGQPVKKLKYVFIDPKGAKTNLEFLAGQMGGAMEGKLTVEVFINGEPRTATTKAGVDKLIKELGT